VTCEESLRVQAYFDDEVDAVSAAQIESHVQGCAECRKFLDDLERLRAALRREVAFVHTPPALRANVLDALDRESTLGVRADGPGIAVWRNRPFWAGAASGIGGAALAASLAFLLWMPPRSDPVLDDLVSAHLRSLMPGHPVDVISTDRHTVKPWLAAHADVSPVVGDFEQEGYRLVGGRAEYFDHQRPAVLVYQHGAHLINVFSWSVDQHGLPRDSTRNGYHLAFWQSGNLGYCAVSDAGWDAVLELKRLLQDLSARDNRE
jgi:anti-sigma factor RsiW